MSDYANAIGIVATNYQFQLALGITLTVALLGVSIGWLKSHIL